MQQDERGQEPTIALEGGGGIDAATENALLRRILGTLSGRLDLADTVRQLAELICEVTGTDVCFVHVADPATGRLTLAGATPPFDHLAGVITLERGEGVAGWVVEQGRPLVVADKWHDPRYKYIPALHGEDYASLVSVPMRARNGTIVGALNVHSRRPREFSDADVGLLTHVAALIAGGVENARLYTRLAQREAELESFTRQTLDLQEAERARLAAEIHDGISQRLVSLAYRLSAAAEAQPPPPPHVAEQIDAARQLATLALDEARRAIAGLRPPLLDDLGLAASLRALASELPDDLAVDLDIEECRLEAHVETGLYRIAQEALQNVVRHAEATRVQVALRCDADAATLTIIDDGRGLDPLAPARRRPGGGGHGLASMRARAELLGGALEIRSAPGSGAELRVTVPVHPR